MKTLIKRKLECLYQNETKQTLVQGILTKIKSLYKPESIKSLRRYNHPKSKCTTKQSFKTMN